MPLSAVRGFSPSALRSAMTRKPAAVNDLADAIGASRQSVSAWLAGRASPTPALLLKAANWLSVSVDDLVPLPPDRLRVSDLRVRAGLSQRDAAPSLGVSASSLTDIEKGRRKVDDRVAKLMAELYGVPVGEVLEAWQRSNEARAAFLKSL